MIAQFIREELFSNFTAFYTVAVIVFLILMSIKKGKPRIALLFMVILGVLIGLLKNF